MVAKNAKVTAENQRLRNDVLQIHRTATTEIERRLKEKESELAEVRIQFETTQKASAKAMTEMQQAVLAYRQHADKWKCKAQTIGLEASDARQTAENEQEQMASEIGRLEEELARRKQLREKCELMLTQLDQQIKTLKSSVTLANKKERQQAALTSQLLAQQNAFSAEKSRHQILLDQLVVKIQRKKRECDGVGRPSGGWMDDSVDVSE
jgi:hypothetical protein